MCCKLWKYYEVWQSYCKNNKGAIFQLHSVDVLYIDVDTSSLFIAVLCFRVLYCRVSVCECVCMCVQFWLVMHYLSRMTDKQTLVMYSGHPLGLFPSHHDAPRAVITNGMVWPSVCLSVCLSLCVSVFCRYTSKTDGRIACSPMFSSRRRLCSFRPPKFPISNI